MRTIVIGDVHGCLDELDELLQQVDYRPGRVRREGDQLVFVGDLVDRGPDPVGVLRRVQELRATCVLGNHEEKHVRYHRHETQAKAGGPKNPMRPFSAKRMAEHRAFREADFEFMAQMSTCVALGWAYGNWIAVHAGLQPGVPVGQQKENVLLRMRSINTEKGKMASIADVEKGPPEKFVAWYHLWDGPESVVYGHAVNVLGPDVAKAPGGGLCIGIDTGCVFGGHLTAAMFEISHTLFAQGAPMIRYAHVKAKQIYYPYDPAKE